MAELILTEEAKEADSLLLWSDESLGKAVRYCASTMKELNEKDALFTVACGQILCALAHKTNAGLLKLTLDGVTESKEPLGNWKITVKKVK